MCHGMCGWMQAFSVIKLPSEGGGDEGDTDIIDIKVPLLRK